MTVDYMLRTCGPNGESSHGFIWPLTVGSWVECPDWVDDPEKECGNAFHGLKNGIGNASLISQGEGRWWQIVKTETANKTISGKSRFRNGEIVFSQPQLTNEDCSAREAAIKFLVDAGCPREGIAWDVVTSGDYGQSTSGYSGQSTSGYSGQSTSGYYGQSTSGYSGQSTSGYSGQCRAGKYGGISIRFYDKTIGGYRIRCGEVGCGDGSDGLLKADVWYRVDENGKFAEVEQKETRNG